MRDTGCSLSYQVKLNYPKELISWFGRMLPDGDAQGRIT